MYNRLQLCTDHLAEVEAKLRELLASSASARESAHISEALSFISQAVAAVSKARKDIAELPEPKREIQEKPDLKL